MTVIEKLIVHLLHIVSPVGIPLTGPEQRKVLAEADEPQRRAAIDRARVRIPFLLPDEEVEAEMWAREGR
jgi:hypothetical protein